MAKSISIAITGSAAPLRKVFGEVEGDLKRFGSSVGGAFKTMGKAAAIGGAAVAAGAVAFGKAAFDAAETAGTSNARIEQVAESMGLFGREAGKVSERLIDLSHEQARLTGVNQNTIKESQALLLTFGEVAASADEAGGAFDRATQLTLDLAAAGFGGVTDNAKQLGKALNDPIKGISALSRSGVTFTDGQKELIETLVESGKMLEAQDMILSEVEKQVGGTAAATANASDQMRVGFSQITERVGMALLPVFEKLTGFVLDKVIPGIESLVSVFEEGGLSGVIDLVTGKIRDKIPAILDTLKEWAGKAASWLINDGLPMLGEKTQQLGQALIDWIGPRIPPMLEALGGFIADAANWVVNTGIPLLVEKMTQLGNELVAWIKPRIQPAIEEIGKLLGEIVAWIVTDGVPKLLVAAGDLAGALIGWVKTIAPEVLKGLGSLLVDLGSWIINDGIPKLLELGKDLGGSMIDGIKDGLGKVLSGASSIARDLVNGIIRFVNTQVIDKVNRGVEFKIGGRFGLPEININPPDIPNIPMLAKGGIVTRPTLAMIGEAGPEAVVPLSGRNMPRGGGNSYNITVQTGVGDPGAIGQSVVEAITAYERRNGAGWRAA